jgi:translocation and assembly module TamB
LTRVLALLAALLLCAGAAGAQDSQAERDRDFLTRLIEDNLSGDGTEVQIFGFAGALSSQARFDRMTIADAGGIWLTIEDAQLDWSRSALLRGSLEVAELSAGRIALTRLPAGGGSAGLPRLTARQFALPDLPVAVQVDKLEARALELGPAVLGEPVTAVFTGALALRDGTGSARLDLRRSDGGTGQALIAAEYSNQTRFLDLTLEVSEAEAGVVARLLDLPGRPALRFSIAGAGPLSDYRAEIALDTGGTSRVGGTLRLDDRDEAGSQGFALALAGDVAPLVRPAYRPFFGDRAEFDLSGVLKADGGTAIDALRVQSGELRLDGSLVTAPDGLPESFRLSGALSPTGPDGALLPLPGPPLRIGGGQIEAGYDAATGAAWTLSASVTDLRRGTAALVSGSLTGSGTIGRAGRSEAAIGSVDGLISASLGGIATGDPALDAALTDRLTAGLGFAWTAGEALRVSDARVTAGATVLSGAASLDGASRNFRVTGTGTLAAPDLSVFAGLYGQALSGGAEAALDGWYEPLGGAFDLTLDARTTALDLGPALPQSLLRGDGSFTGGLARSVTGTLARDLKIATPRLQATLTGGLGTEAGQLALDARLADLAELVPGLSGPVALNGTLGRSGETLVLDLQASGPPEVTARLTGTAQADFSTADIGFDAAIADLAALIPALAGPATARGSLTLAEGRLRFEAATQAEPGLSADLSGTSGLDLADLDVTVAAALADLAAFVPQLAGPVQADGTVRRVAEGYRLDLDGTALGRAEFALAGTTAADLATVDLQLTGTAPLELAAPFAPGLSLAGLADLDLALSGPPGLAALTGALSTLDARIAIGNLALERLAGRLTLDPEAMAEGARFAAGIRVTRATVVAPGQSWARLLPTCPGHPNTRAQCVLSIPFPCPTGSAARCAVS